MKRTNAIAIVAALACAAPAVAQDGPSLTIGGTTYTKWLWSTQRDQGSLYNFTTVPGEGYGNNGQGTEIELLINGKLSRAVEVKGRIHSRFSQNQWTNFGGFGGTAPTVSDGRVNTGSCIEGDCGEFDPRSNQYVKLRGVSVILTPGYGWIDTAVIGSNDWGQFDPFVVGRIRYIDRDNGQGLLFQGSALNRLVSWDLARISLPRLWAGPNFSTGEWHASDATYVGQLRFAPSQTFGVTLLADFVNDQEIDPEDFVNDDGRDMAKRYRNVVAGAKVGMNLGMLDARVNGYYAYSNTYQPFLGVGSATPETPFNVGFPGFHPVAFGRMEDWAGTANVTLNDPLGVGLTINVQGFFIGSDYMSIMASRREADVLLTEGFDATWANPGPANASFGVFAGNPTRIGYGGWSGTTQQVPTLNIDNEFTDFDEPAAQTVIGWMGGTVNPVWSSGPLEVAGEYSFITYDTNWQAWDNPNRPINVTPYPVAEGDTGVGRPFRNAYAPFQDRRTHIAVLRAKYVLDVLRGVDLFGKVKYIRETDDRMTDARFLPFEADGVTRREYSPGNSTADIYGAGTGFKAFTDLADDDRDLKYWSFNVGAGYQFTDDFYASLTYAKYLADLQDGNSAFQAYNLHEMASGDHDKNQLIANAKYNLAGMEFGFEGQYSFGTFEPDFGPGLTVVTATPEQAADFRVQPGTRGFIGRFGGWNTLDERDFDEWRLKAFMKTQF